MAWKFCSCRTGKDFLQVIHIHSFWLYPHPRPSTAIVQLTTYYILLRFLQTVFPNCSSFLCPVPRSPNSLLSPPNPVVSSLPIISFLSCVYAPHIFPHPKAEFPSLCHMQRALAHLISISSLHYCYKINHSPHQCATLSGRGAGLRPQKFCIFSLSNQHCCASCPAFSL